MNIFLEKSGVARRGGGEVTSEDAYLEAVSNAKGKKNRQPIHPRPAPRQQEEQTQQNRPDCCCPPPGRPGPPMGDFLQVLITIARGHSIHLVFSHSS
jgi:hypothetical protein